MTKWIAPALMIVSLGACGDGAKKAEGAGTAQGEVLPAAASDAMIPLDQVKSQAPLAPMAEGSDKKDAKDPAKTKTDAPAKAADDPTSAEAEPEAVAGE